MHDMTHVKFWVTLKHGEPHWCTYWCTLLLQYLDKVKVSFQCITYLLLILNSNMHWLKYIWCKTSTEQNLTLHALFAFLLSRIVYQDDFLLLILRTILYHGYLSPRLVYHLVNSLFWLGRFPILLCNVFWRTETRREVDKGSKQR